MKARLIIMSAVFFNLFSCDMSNGEFDLIESKGLVGDNLHLRTMIFYNGDTGFIAGSSDVVASNPNYPITDSNRFAFVNSHALLFKTTDGGKTWEKNEFGEGSFSDIVILGGVLFAIKANDNKFDISIYSSSNYGSSWDANPNFPKGIYTLFSYDGNLCAIRTDSSKLKSYLNLSGDKGKNWSGDRILEYFPSNKPVQYNDKILYLSNSERSDYFPDLVILYDISKDACKVIELPKSFDCYFLSRNNEEVRLVGTKDNCIAVYSLQKDNQIRFEYRIEEEGRIFPQGYYYRNGEEWLVIGKRSEHFMSNKILKSSDNGKNWETFHFEKDTYIEPFAFLSQNNRVKSLFYSGSGKFQVLK